MKMMSQLIKSHFLMEVRVLKMKKNTCFLNHFNLCKKSGDDTTNYIWESQTFINELWLKHSIKQNLTDQYLQTWLSSVNDSPKALNYRIY
jgi:hypothetical protein